MTRRTRLHAEALDDRCLPSLSPVATLPVGNFPAAVVTADFDNDGDLDLATANYSDNNVSVLLGDGRGDFGAASHFAAGSGPGSLAVGDLDGDGRLDLLTADEVGWGVSVLLGNGDGTFQPPVATVLGTWPHSVAVGDFNGDGLMDVAAGSSYYDFAPGTPDPSYVTVLLSDGAGGFQASNSYTLPGEGGGILAVADLDGDSHLDVVTLIGHPDGTVTDGVLMGNGDGTFAPPIATPRTGWEVAVADFNGDGRLDAVTLDQWAGTVSVLLRNGEGTLFHAGEFAVGSWPTGLAVGDFDADGRPDVAVAVSGSDAVLVLRNDGGWPAEETPRLRIGDATVTEGNAGTVLAVFIVTLTVPSDRPVTVAYATADGTALAGSDYVAASGTVTIPAGQTSATFTVAILGDRLGEANESFAVNLNAPTNATIADGQGVGTVLDDEPRISVGDATVTEGNTGTVSATFTVTLSSPADAQVSVRYSTADGTAAAGSDYQAVSGTLTFAPGETSKTVTVLVNGDQLFEPNETFTVNLGSPTGASIADGTGVGTVVNDDSSLPRISISDVSVREGRKGNTFFIFTVTLSAPSATQVKVSYATADGTARSGEDYEAAGGTLTFAPGETTKTVVVKVKGDQKREADETFSVNLFGVSGALLLDPQRLGTILNDD